MRCQRKYIPVQKNIAVAHFETAKLVLTLLYKLTLNVFQILRNRSNDSDNIFDFAISCEITHLITMEAFYKSKIDFLSRSQYNYSLGLDRRTRFFWMLFSLEIECATRYKLFFCLKTFGFCCGQLFGWFYKFF